MSRFAPYIVILMLLAAVGFLLRNGCKPAPSHQTDKNAVDSTKVSDSLYHQSLLTHIEKLQGDSARQQDKIDNDERELASEQAELWQQGDAIGHTLKTYDSVRIVHDTPAIVQTCDTLALQVTLAKAEVYGYQTAVDSLIAAKDRQSVIKDSISQAWRSAFLHSDTANAFLQGKYNSLYLDYVKTARKSSLTGKAILPAAIAGLVIGLLLKK